MQYQMNQMKYVTKHDRQLKHSGQAIGNTDCRNYDRNDAISTYIPQKYRTKNLPGMSWDVLQMC